MHVSSCKYRVWYLPNMSQNNIEYLLAEIKNNVISNINKDIISLHVYSIHLQTDKVCLTELKSNRTTTWYLKFVSIFLIKYCNMMHLKDIEVICILLHSNTINELFNICMCLHILLECTFYCYHIKFSAKLAKWFRVCNNWRIIYSVLSYLSNKCKYA